MPTAIPLKKASLMPNSKTRLHPTGYRPVKLITPETPQWWANHPDFIAVGRREEAIICGEIDRMDRFDEKTLANEQRIATDLETAPTDRQMIQTLSGLLGATVEIVERYLQSQP